MNVTKFLSSGNFIMLPTKSQPKVYLSFDKKSVLDKAFKLYNPFSKKALLFKSVVVFATKYFKPFCSLVLPIVKIEQSEFSKYLNETLKKSLTISLYKATENDKVVLQLLDENSNIYGYLKYPISEIGKQRVLNEKQAIDILSRRNVIPEILFEGNFKGTPYIILNNIEGRIGKLKDQSYKIVLKKLYKEKAYKLMNHPRVVQLQMEFNKLKFEDITKELETSINNSNAFYKVVYEHGDFAPWNLKHTTNSIVPFDFEYFVEDGLEYLDELKYHFQINYLLNGLTGIKLINTLRHQLALQEFDVIFKIFLLKEIINKQKLNKSIDLETSLLILV